MRLWATGLLLHRPGNFLRFREELVQNGPRLAHEVAEGQGHFLRPGGGGVKQKGPGVGPAAKFSIQGSTECSMRSYGEEADPPFASWWTTVLSTDCHPNGPPELPKTVVWVKWRGELDCPTIVVAVSGWGLINFPLKNPFFH